MDAVGKNIVVKDVSEKTTKTDGGLILGELNREDIRYREAEVLLVGDQVSVINKGDKVYYDRHAGFNVDIESDVWKVIKEQDIVIVL